MILFSAPAILGLALGSVILWGIGIAVLVLVALFWFWPTLLIRLPLWLLCHTIYRLRVIGRQHVPQTGPALLVCNHVGFLDWMFLLASQPRFLHFVIFAGWTRKFGLRHIFKWAGVIPIDKSSGPRAIVQSLRLAGEALARGEVVCIFAEGRFTRTGFLLPFHRGFEQIVKHCPAPIIPVCLEQVWGSIFSYWGSKVIWKWPHELPYPVTIAFGAPLPPTTAAAETRQAVQKLSADCAIERSARKRPVHRQFVRRAARRPFRQCIVDPTLAPDQARSYGQVLVEAMTLARQLRAQLDPNRPHVGIWLPPGYWSAVSNLAVALLGKVSVNLDYTSAPAALKSAAAQCELRQVLATRSFAQRVPIVGAAAATPLYVDELATSVPPWRKNLAWLGVLLLPGVVLERWVLRLGRQRPDDLLTVIFTDGRADESTGVMLSHRNIAANVESLIQVIDLRPQDRVLSALPWSGGFGYTSALWVPLQVGASVVVHDDPTAAREFGALCREHRCTILLATPSLLGECLEQCGSDDFTSLRCLWCGSEPLPPNLAQQFEEKFRVRPMPGYGRTELSPVAAVNVPDKDLDGFRQIGHKPGTVGLPLPGVAARIVDPATFAPLPAGSEGSLLVYGANVMTGYLDHPSATQSALRDGWFVTGDTAKLDEDGFLTIVSQRT